MKYFTLLGLFIVISLFAGISVQDKHVSFNNNAYADTVGYYDTTGYAANPNSYTIEARGTTGGRATAFTCNVAETVESLYVFLESYGYTDTVHLALYRDSDDVLIDSTARYTIAADLLGWIGFPAVIGATLQASTDYYIYAEAKDTINDVHGCGTTGNPAENHSRYVDETHQRTWSAFDNPISLAEYDLSVNQYYAFLTTTTGGGQSGTFLLTKD